MPRSSADIARQRQVWDKAAPSYGKHIAFFDKVQFGGGREWPAERALGRVLEVAIGAGLSLPHYKADAIIAGIELSPRCSPSPASARPPLGREVDLREGDVPSMPAAGRLMRCAPFPPRPPPTRPPPGG